MDFALSPEQEAIRDTARAFARDRIAPYALAWEETGIPRAVLAEAGALGFAAMYVPEDQGGAGLSRLDATLVFEALAEACPATSAFLSIHNMCAWMLATWGTDAARARHLPGLLTLERYCAYCLTEPGSGSDAAALATRATRTADRLDPDRHQGLHLRRRLRRPLPRHGPHRRRRPEGHLRLPRPGRHPRPLLRRPGAQDGLARPAHRPGPARRLRRSPPTTSSAPKATASATPWPASTAAASTSPPPPSAAPSPPSTRRSPTPRERHAFGRPLTDFQALQFRLADMETELQAARVFLHQAAWKLDRKAPDATKACAMAKRLVTDTAFRVANDALQLLGGYGYLADYGIEKIVRDLRVHQILEGTNEIMRVIVARALLAERA